MNLLTIEKEYGKEKEQGEGQGEGNLIDIWRNWNSLNSLTIEKEQEQGHGQGQI